MLEFKNEFLRPIFTDEKIMIPATSGGKIILKATDIFRFISPNFINLDLNNKGKATEEITVKPFKLTKDKKFGNIFRGFKKDLNDLVLTQHQIIDFCRINKKFLVTGWPSNFFLIKENGEFFVVFVSSNFYGWDVNVNRLSIEDVWHASSKHHFFVAS